MNSYYNNDTLLKLQAEIARLREELAAAQKDAERYRLAREWGVRTLVTRWGGDRYCTKTMERADAAIDDAIAKEKTE